MDIRIKSNRNHLKQFYIVNLTKTWLGDFLGYFSLSLGDFLTKTSGHPDWLLPSPLIHWKMARTILDTGWGNRRNQQIMSGRQTQWLQRHLGRSPQYEVITRDKLFLELVALGMSAAALTLSTFDSAKISHLETQIVNNNKRVDHLVDITALHKNHFRAVDKKLYDMANKLATLIKINKAHFAKMMDFM